MPRVLNKRTRNIPKDAVYVGRPSKWGNPYRIGDFYAGKRLTRQDCVDLHRADLLREIKENPAKLDEIRRELRGKDLACWCYPEPCHAEVLLELANK